MSFAKTCLLGLCSMTQLFNMKEYRVRNHNCNAHFLARPQQQLLKASAILQHSCIIAEDNADVAQVLA